MCEDYRSDGPESSVTTSSQPSGTEDGLILSAPCPVRLPRELTLTEKTLWERYKVLNDDDYYGYALGLVDSWRYRLPPTLDILESLSEGVQPSDVEGQLLAVVHMMRRALDDLGAIVNLAHEMVPYDRKLLRHIQKERGAVLMVPAITDAPQSSTDQDLLQ